MFSNAVLAALLVAGHALQATASVGGHGSHALFARAADLHHHLRRDASRVLADAERRQAPPSSAPPPDPTISTMPQSGNAANANLTAWQEQTSQACMTALMAQSGPAMNPSGMAVCYDLPFRDNSTGIFQAELRMYNMSPPTGAWAGMTMSDVSLTLSYLGATVQATNGTMIMKRDGVELARVVHSATVRVADLAVRQDLGTSTNIPTEIKILSYVGKVNSNLMGPVMSAAAVQQFLVPEIGLSAQSPNVNNGQPVTTTLGSNAASLINGVFMREQANPTFDNPAAAASATAAVAKAAPFVLPGTKLAFFPVGLVITSVWTGALFLAVGFGTFGRMKFRDQYRRRMRRDGAVGVQRL